MFPPCVPPDGIYRHKKRNLATPIAEQAAINTPEASSGTVSSNIILNSDKKVNTKNSKQNSNEDDDIRYSEKMTEITEDNILKSSRNLDVEEAEQDILSENDLEEYLKAGGRRNISKQEALADGKKIILTTEDEITSFIHKSIEGDSNLTTVGYGKVRDRLSRDVESYSSADIKISGNFLELVPNDIRHAYNEHLTAKEPGDIDLSLNDFENIPFYIKNYDELVYAVRFKSGNTRICLSKKLENRRVLIIETVSKSRGSIAFKNMIGVSEEKYVNEYLKEYKKRNSPNSRGSESFNISLHDETVSNNIILNSDKKVNTKNSNQNCNEDDDIRYSEKRTEITEDNILESSKEDVKLSERNFSYKELVAKGEIQGVVIKKNQQVKLTADGRVDIKYLMKEIHEKCEKIETKSKEPTYYVNVPDISRNVVIVRKSVEHGFIKNLLSDGAKFPPTEKLNARVSLELPEILKNSIEVNRSFRDKSADVPYTHVMLGTVAMENEDGTVEHYAVRMMVEEKINQGAVLTEANILGKLKAINTKKVGSPQDWVIEDDVALTSSKTYTYNIAELLENVKTEFNDTFSLDVYEKLGMKRHENEFSDNLLYSERYDVSIYDLMGEYKRAINENKRLEADVKSLKAVGTQRDGSAVLLPLRL